MKARKIFFAFLIFEIGLAMLLFSPSNYSHGWDGEMVFNGLFLAASGIAWFFKILFK